MYKYWYNENITCFSVFKLLILYINFKYWKLTKKVIAGWAYVYTSKKCFVKSSIFVHYFINDDPPSL